MAIFSEDQLLIALLLQAMSHESDEAHVMERNPSSFDDCRKYILGLETARRGAKTISDSPAGRRFDSAAYHKPKSSNYKKSRHVERKPNSNYGFCGGYSHPRDSCPSKDTNCNNCGRLGHGDVVWRSKLKSKKVGAVFKRVASSQISDV